MSQSNPPKLGVLIWELDWTRRMSYEDEPGVKSDRLAHRLIRLGVPAWPFVSSITAEANENRIKSVADDKTNSDIQMVCVIIFRTNEQLQNLLYLGPTGFGVGYRPLMPIVLMQGRESPHWSPWSPIFGIVHEEYSDVMLLNSIRAASQMELKGPPNEEVVTE